MLNEDDNSEEYKEEERVLLMELPETNEIITLADGTVIDAKQNEVQTEEQKKLHLQKRDEVMAIEVERNLQISIRIINMCKPLAKFLQF